jgi:hypothetical protein
MFGAARAAQALDDEQAARKFHAALEEMAVKESNRAALTETLANAKAGGG